MHCPTLQQPLRGRISIASFRLRLPFRAGQLWAMEKAPEHRRSPRPVGVLTGHRTSRQLLGVRALPRRLGRSAGPSPPPCAGTSGRRGRTTGHRWDTTHRPPIRRLRLVAMPRRRNGAARAASRCRRSRSRRDAGRGGDRQSHTRRARRLVSEAVRASQ